MQNSDVSDEHQKHHCKKKQDIKTQDILDRAESSFFSSSLGEIRDPSQLAPSSHSQAREKATSAVRHETSESVTAVLRAPNISNISKRPLDGSSPMLECVGTLEKKGQTFKSASSRVPLCKIIWATSEDAVAVIQADLAASLSMNAKMQHPLTMSPQTVRASA